MFLVLTVTAGDSQTDSFLASVDYSPVRAFALMIPYGGYVDYPDYMNFDHLIHALPHETDHVLFGHPHPHVCAVAVPCVVYH